MLEVLLWRLRVLSRENSQADCIETSFNNTWLLEQQSQWAHFQTRSLQYERRRNFHVGYSEPWDHHTHSKDHGLVHEHAVSSEGTCIIILGMFWRGCFTNWTVEDRYRYRYEGIIYSKSRRAMLQWNQRRAKQSHRASIQHLDLQFSLTWLNQWTSCESWQ